MFTMGGRKGWGDLFSLWGLGSGLLYLETCVNVRRA